MNLFEKAKSNPVVKSPKSALTEASVSMQKFEPYAFADALGKAIDSLKTSMKAALHEQMYAKYMVNKGETFKGEEKTAKGTFMLNKRSSTSGLKEVEIELLEDSGISMQRIEGDFKFNPTYMGDPAIQKKISDAFKKAGLPDDIVQFDASKARTITTEDSINEVFKLNDPDTIRALLPIVGVPTIKPQTSAKLSVILDTVTKMLVVEGGDEETTGSVDLMNALRQSLSEKPKTRRSK